MRYVLCITSCALPGRDSDYNRWYDETHLPEVLALPGFESCERFVREAAENVGQPEYVSLYEVRTDDPQAFLQALFAASANMVPTDAIDGSTARFEFLRPSGQ